MTNFTNQDIKDFFVNAHGLHAQTIDRVRVEYSKDGIPELTCYVDGIFFKFSPNLDYLLSLELDNLCHDALIGDLDDDQYSRFLFLHDELKVDRFAHFNMFLENFQIIA